MKLKSMFMTLLILIFASMAFAGPILNKVIDATTIVASGNTTSSVIPREGQSMAGIGGYFTLYVAVTGDGTAKIEYLASLDGITYLEPSTATDVATGLTKTSGPGSDGKTIVRFGPIAAPKYKIKVTETGGANSVIVTVWAFIY